MNSSDPKVIVALDFPEPVAALALADRLDPKECALKVGKELFVSGGPEPVRRMVDRGFNVFLDLKFHDIPNTVASACAAAVKLGVWMMNVHASGGRAMLRAAREAVDTTALATSRRTPLLIGVTVLTSLTDDDLREVGHASTVMGEVSVLAQLARHADSTASFVRRRKPPRCGRICRASSSSRRASASADARRTRLAIVTPEVAIRAGADYLVIGRPITQAADPPATLRAINVSLPLERRSHEGHDDRHRLRGTRHRRLLRRGRQRRPVRRCRCAQDRDSQ
jgi:orotidine-5'-phosphate decarboxylase